MDGAWRPDVAQQLSDDARAAVVRSLRDAASALESNPDLQIEAVVVLHSRTNDNRSTVWLATDPFAPRGIWVNEYDG